VNVFGWNYPAGAENDPAAPWNQKDAEECRECEGHGTKINHDGSDGVCPVCDGTGELPERMSIYERDCEKADRARDEAKDAEQEPP